MIKLINIDKYFNKRKSNEIHVINNTTLELPSTGLVCLLGASGSGKTTLLNVIGGLDKYKGQIVYDDLTIKNYKMRKVDDYRRKNLGYIFQNYLLFPDMTVYDNLKFALSLSNIYDKDEVEDRINYCLNAVNMINYKRRRASALSGGQQQRVAIARALVKKSKVIIADEPTGNLDSANTIEVMNIIKKVSKTCLVILVTHDRNLASFYADRIVELKDGKVISDEINFANNSFDHDDGRIIYLKDLEHKKVEEKDYSLDLYYDELPNEKPNIKVIYKNGSLIIDVKSNLKVKYQTSNSELTIKDEHFKKLEKSDLDNFNYDNSFFKDISKRKIDFRKLWNNFKVAFFNFYFVKFRYKIMYLAFVIVGMLIAYTSASISNAYTFDEKAYIKNDPSFVEVDGEGKQIEIDFNEVRANDSILGVAYYLGRISFMVDTSINYQTQDQLISYQGGRLIPSNIINEKDLIYGSLPSSETEIGISKWVCDELTQNAQYLVGRGISCRDFVGRKVLMNGFDTEFTITGVINRSAYVVIVDFSTYLNFSLKNSSVLTQFRTFNEEIGPNTQLIDGRMPTKSGEIIINKVFGLEIGDEIDKLERFNTVYLDKTYTIVGICESTNLILNFVVPEDGEKLLEKYWNGYNLYFISSNKSESVSYLKDLGYKAMDAVKEDKANYSKQRINNELGPIIFSTIMTAALLIFVFFMMRSKVIHRIYDVGVYRALGASRLKVISLFVLEILILTTFTTVIGYGFVTYIIYYVNSILSSFGGGLLFPIYNVLLGLALIYALYLLFGLLPVILLLRKTPSQILTKYDI